MQYEDGWLMKCFEQVYRHLLFNRLGRDDNKLDVSLPMPFLDPRAPAPIANPSRQPSPP